MGLDPVDVVQRGFGLLAPYVQAITGYAMPPLTFAAGGAFPYGNTLVMDVDRQRRRWMVRVNTPVMAESYLQPGTNQPVLLELLCHEVFHPLNLEAERRHHRLDWPQILFTEEPGPLDPTDPWDRYYYWNEGSAQLASVVLQFSLIRQGLADKILLELFGRRNLEGTWSFETTLARLLSETLATVHRYGLVNNRGVEALELPVEVPESIKRLHIERCARRFQISPQHNPEYGAPYYIFMLVCARIMRRQGANLAQLLSTPLTIPQMQLLAGMPTGSLDQWKL